MKFWKIKIGDICEFVLADYFETEAGVAAFYRRPNTPNVPPETLRWWSPEPPTAVAAYSKFDSITERTNP